MNKEKNKKIARDKQRILITGGAGYIGSILTRLLLEDGHEVTVFDKLLFGKESLEILNYLYPDSFNLIEGDIKNHDTLRAQLKEKDSIIHLAAIVGDPACSVRVEDAVETNFKASKALAEMANDSSIPRFLFASTCSVYGANNSWLDENSDTQPISLYGRTKLNAEKHLLNNHLPNTKTVVFRLGTIFGLSPRMRFDLVVNHLTKKAIFDGEIKIFGGDQWRPFVHVRDVAKVFHHVVSMPEWDGITGKVYNVGSNKNNFRIKDLPGALLKVFPSLDVSYIPEAEDRRSYRVDFSRLHNQLGIRPSISITEGIAEIKKAFFEGCIVDPDEARYYNYKAWD